MFLNFACLTRRVPCSDKKDIMPAAFVEAMGWFLLPREASDQKPLCEEPDPRVLELAARDARNIVIAKVGATKRPYTGPGGLYERTLLLEEILKARGLPKSRIPTKFWMYEFPRHGGPLNVGMSAIMFLRDDNFNGNSFDDCSPLSVTAAHLSIVQQGITEDTRPVNLPSFASGTTF